MEHRTDIDQQSASSTVSTSPAGIELRGKDRRMRGINYNAEVAFEKKPVPGFYDTGDEVRHTKEMQQEFRPTTVEEMEGKRRKVCTQLIRPIVLCITHVANSGPVGALSRHLRAAHSHLGYACHPDGAMLRLLL